MNRAQKAETEWKAGMRTHMLDRGVAGDRVDEMVDYLWREAQRIADEFAPPVPHPIHPCQTEGCPGDGRYAAPGRGHREGCRWPLAVPSTTPVQGDTDHTATTNNGGNQ